MLWKVVTCCYDLNLGQSQCALAIQAKEGGKDYACLDILRSQLKLLEFWLSNLLTVC